MSIKKGDKRGLSIMIGYVLLISAAVFMSFIVYTWMKSYIPQEKPECPSDVSVIIENSDCISSGDANKIKITMKNNGLFSVHGYILTGYDEFGEVIDLSNGYYYFSSPCSPDQENHGGEFPEEADEDTVLIKRIELIPIRLDEAEENSRELIAVCGDAKVSKTLDGNGCLVHIPSS